MSSVFIPSAWIARRPIVTRRHSLAKPNFQKFKKGEVKNDDGQTSEEREVDEDEDEIYLIDIGI